jgi:N-acetylmuramoyl-L-alanine amidase
MTLSAGLVCLALTIFNESRGEPIKGQYGVALVTMNRIESSKYPDTPCAVVFEKGEYQWAPRSKSQRTLWKLKRRAEKKDDKSWSRSVKIAHQVIRGQVKDWTRGALYFNHKKKGRKYKTKVRAQVVGRHIFY